MEWEGRGGGQYPAARGARGSLRPHKGRAKTVQRRTADTGWQVMRKFIRPPHLCGFLKERVRGLMAEHKANPGQDNRTKER